MTRNTNAALKRCSTLFNAFTEEPAEVKSEVLGLKSEV
jgi:hypothetical protein